MSNSKFQHYYDELDTYLKLRDLAMNTVKSYHSCLRAYRTWTSETLDVSHKEVTYVNICSYLLNSKRLRTFQIQYQCSLLLNSFFRTFILKQGWDSYEVPRMRCNTHPPFILSNEEVFTFIDSIPNLKHKAFVATIG